MMDFVMLTTSFTVGILLATGIAMVIVMHPKVMKWYMKYMFILMKRFDQLVEELEDEGL